MSKDAKQAVGKLLKLTNGCSEKVCELVKVELGIDIDQSEVMSFLLKQMGKIMSEKDVDQ